MRTRVYWLRGTVVRFEVTTSDGNRYKTSEYVSEICTDWETGAPYVTCPIKEMQYKQYLTGQYQETINTDHVVARRIVEQCDRWFKIEEKHSWWGGITFKILETSYG